MTAKVTENVVRVRSPPGYGPQTPVYGSNYSQLRAALLAAEPK